MTNIKKATDLVNQFRMILMDEDTECGNEILCTLIAIKCAKITVNEMIEHCSQVEPFLGVEFWNDVEAALNDL